MARRAGRYVALAAALALTTAGCGTASDPSPPTGVDELVIPTGELDPDEYVDRVDNAWFPLAPGSVWVYAASGPVDGTATVRVLDETVSVDGVAATAVERTAPDGTTATDLYAQDRRGNVWWVGREGEWQVGEAGAEAGLAMPAHPRLGDGWRAAYDEGVVDVRLTVESLTETAVTPAGRYADAVALDGTDALADDSVRSLYAQGVGLVKQVSLEGLPSELELEDGPG